MLILILYEIYGNVFFRINTHVYMYIYIYIYLYEYSYIHVILYKHIDFVYG